MLHAYLKASAAALGLAECTTVPANHPLTGTAWRLVSITADGTEITLDPPLQRRHTLVFTDAQTLNLKLDCNRGRADWTAGRPRGGTGAISIGRVVSSTMACPDPSFGQQLSGGVGTAQRFVAARGSRTLVLEGGAARLTFTAAE